MALEFIPHFYIYSKTGVCMGEPIFLIFDPNVFVYGYLLDPPHQDHSDM